MSVFNRAKAIDQQFLAYLEGPARQLTVLQRLGPDDRVPPGSRLEAKTLVDLADSQFKCRHLDLIARELRARDAAFYTIGSSGHEGNVVLGCLVRATDPTFLHYRSGALMVQRSKQRPEIDPLLDTLLSQAASADDPIAGGRHKVWGSRALWVPPQTSTIASHLPKAVGAAIAIDRAKKLRLPLPVPDDSITVCTFGDASVNHSVAQGAFNAAGWTDYQRIPVPTLFVCEDNGIGISTHTPAGWTERNLRSRSGWTYFYGDGLNLVDAYEAAAAAIEHCRQHRVPTILHLRTIRMTGHAGSDVETTYHTLDQIAAVEALDPLLTTVRLLIENGILSADQIRDQYEAIRERTAQLAEDVVVRPKLRSIAEIVRPLAPFSPAAVDAEARRSSGQSATGSSGPKHMAALINRGLAELLEKYPQSMLFGEDVAKKGGVYNVTQGLHTRFGPARVFNTLLDETTILGLGLGAAHLGFLPIPEIQYLAYLHNAEDQLRSEACSLQFFSQAQFRNPLLVRLAGLAYQKGFGGHFHNDNSVAVLRDIPGLILATPARGDDAVKMMRTGMALCQVDGRIVVFLEPIALYMTKDLHDGDGAWQCEYPGEGETIPLGEGAVYNADGRDLLIVSYANGLYMSLRAAKQLGERHNVRARLLDLRWLSPLNHDWIAQHAEAVGRVLIVDECRRSGGVGEAIVAGLRERCSVDVKIQLLAATDTYVPLGPAMTVVMPTEETILEAALQLAGSRNPTVHNS
jgi:2-oxoisovalerate dehydrogenase E1 component